MFVRLPRSTSRLSRGPVRRWRRPWLGAVLLAIHPSCVVWKDDYDVMAAKYRNEAAAHELARQDLAKRSEEVMKLQNQITGLEASLAESRERLDQNAESLAQAEYQYSILEQQREEASDLVAQLRAEQERLATHLKAYANDRAELSAERERLTEELQTAELRAEALTQAQKRAQARLALVRDLSLKLRQEIERQQAELLFDGDVVVLRLDATKMFTDKGVTKEGKRLLAAAGKALTEGTPATAKPDKTGKPAQKVDSPDTGVASAPKEPPPRLVLSHWQKGQKLRDSSERLKLAATEMALAGVEPTRFAHEKVLLGYQAAAAAVLAKPQTSLGDEGEGEGVDNSPPVAPPLVVQGSSLVVHLVPQ